MLTQSLQIVSLDMSQAMAVRQYGGKIANLASLVSLGVQVPPGMALGIDIFAYFLQSNGIDLESVEDAHHRGMIFLESALEEAEGWQQKIIETINSAPFPDDLRSEIFSKTESLPGSLFAVRSSCIIEDSSSTSFAGQYTTLLEVQRGEDLLNAIRACWASQYQGRVLTYALSRRGMPILMPSMAVLVQSMVAPNHAGVCFTEGPTPKTREYAIVESIPGLGEALVSGEVTPSHFEITADSAIRRSIVSPSSPSRPSDAEILRIASECRKIAYYFGVPQDVEWALDGDQIYILQARPITTLEERKTPSHSASFMMDGALDAARESVSTRPLLDLRDDLHEWIIAEIDPFVYRSVIFLLTAQNTNGSWSLEFHPEWDVVGTAVMVQLLTAGGVPPGMGWMIPGLNTKGSIIGLPAATSWLISNANDDGTWGTDIWDTCQVLHALIGCGLEHEDPIVSRALSFVIEEVKSDFSYSREQEWFGPGVYAAATRLFAEAEMPSMVSTLVKLMVNAQAGSGEFLGPHHQSNTSPVPSVWHTAQAITSLARYADKGDILAQTALARACKWLVSKQHPDGSWGVRTDPYSKYNIFFTSYSLIALSSAGIMHGEEVKRAYKWLKGRQIGSGSFGDIASTLMAVAAMQELNQKVFKVDLPLPVFLRIQATLGSNRHTY